jgi:uncharacterized protein with NAD-binding domain and iron-sulfur cluster
MSKQKIVIVGAGPAGLSAAFFLTDPATNPDWKNRYEIDVYQLGWRVGGKGATGRNIDACERIQEHGIHVFGNMYFNSLRMMQTCFAEVAWDQHDRNRTMEDAFQPSTLTLMTDYFNGMWHRDLDRFPDNLGAPWKGQTWPIPHGIVVEVLNMVSERLARLIELRNHAKAPWFERIVEGIDRLAGDELTRIATAIADRIVDEEKSGHPDRARHALILKVLADAVAFSKLLYEADPSNPTLRATFLNIDLAVTTLRGMIDDDIFDKGIDSMDGENYREWLERHGASQTTLCSGLPQIYPNTALSYEFGDTTSIPSMSAMAYASFFLRQVLGKGAGAYFFAEGTGETIMKPLYRLLCQRGVRIHFFHKLTAVVPDPQLSRIDQLEFDVQATVKAGSYDPLRRISQTGELVWPDRPNYDQLVEGEELRQGGYDLESWWTPWKPVTRCVLRQGEDFDQIVLATPIATLPHTCDAVIRHPAAGDAWRNMITNIKTAASQQVQIWLNKPTSELGWDAKKSPTDHYVGPLYNQDLTSFCDFSDIIDREQWPENNRPKGLIYFIGALSDPEQIPPFDDHEFPSRQRERIKWATIQYLRNIDGLLPGATTKPLVSPSFDFDLLAAHDPATRGRGVNQFDQQFFRANIDPNERYTLSVKGSVQYRLESWDSKFDNLVLAGDWIYTGFNVGSFEGAVMSGKLASLALTGAPIPSEIYGYTFLNPGRTAPSRIRLGTARAAT